MEKLTMDELVNYCKQYGFIYQGSEIYGGLANAWDYGPLGSLLKQNIKNAWWKKFIQECSYNYGLDSAILMNPKVWVASGHVASFSDPLIDCKHCKSRFRADNLIADATKGSINGDGLSSDELVELIKEKDIKCPKCGNKDWTGIRKFNLLFETYQGVTEDAKNKVYLRGETAQGIFVNFKNVERSMRAKIPFGIGQYGKSFRNEITPGNFIFRTREFEQMELEFFCLPGTDLEWFGFWRAYCLDFLKLLGINKDNLRFRDHKKEELSFYSNATTDIEYNFPFGWGELWGIADRTDYDLGVHMESSGEDLRVINPETNEKYLPYVIEPSVGVDRLLLTAICDAYSQELVAHAARVDLKIKP
jgi:glycyl-tRNA synthetase